MLCSVIAYSKRVRVFQLVVVDRCDGQSFLYNLMLLFIAGFRICFSQNLYSYYTCTGMGKRVVARLHKLATRGQRESGGGIHAT